MRDGGEKETEGEKASETERGRDYVRKDGVRRRSDRTRGRRRGGREGTIGGKSGRPRKGGRGSERERRDSTI